MSYSRAKELIKEELGKEGQAPTKFGIHSLCSGGTSAAAALGVPDRLFHRHGGWRSEKTRNKYKKESLHSLLLVPSQLKMDIDVAFDYTLFIPTACFRVLSWTFKELNFHL